MELPNMTQVKEVNTQTGEINLRDFTENELEALEAYKIKEAAKLKIEKEKAAAKAALLERLGITEEEAKLLLS
ncbi:MAG: hypothetical protein EBR82_63340 [Caulobacteraceae bacterium]|nr:hypothetical protein [Caulobacteraceae bacterium]